ncbi:PREDICTED: uncharacterized protein LOC105448201 [Wasmannia auropunctata]|uniref:uncharacterized protein LOC105448201 n=1 Tax=Wasmannia auropunctata TaxID=64793 RepID=UPI0005EF5DA5|nr:PREDICTED: uncharacterized protein LOC105448201 [Wasmannia auropunctata]
MTDLSSLVKSRGRVKAKLTAFGSFLSLAEIEVEKQLELANRLEKAEALWNEFDLLQNKIEDLDESDERMQQRIDFEDTYHELISKARRMSLKDQPVHPLLSTAMPQAPMQARAVALNEPGVVQSRVKLPNIDLPKFNGNYERWVPFRDLFESLIATNPALSAVQKLYYLRSALTGEAAKVIASIEITNDNYAVAWDLLKSRFENKRLIVQYLIQTLLDLTPISKESYADLRLLVDNVSQYIQTLSKLEQPVESWGTLLIHIVLPKIDKGSRREWELKRSTIEQFPTITEFIEFLINRSSFLEALSHVNRNAQPSGEARSSNKAAHPQGKGVSQTYVATDKGSCSMCSKDHKLYECCTFLGMSAEDRNAEIRKKRLCIKCFKNFHGRNCRASNCRECHGNHNTLLHKSKTAFESSSTDGTKAKANEEHAAANQRVAVATASEGVATSLNYCKC